MAKVKKSVRYIKTSNVELDSKSYIKSLIQHMKRAQEFRKIQNNQNNQKGL